MSSQAKTGSRIDAFVPKGHGHQFVLYGDSCSGIPGHLHAANLARINSVVARFHPRPEFIVFPGDEVIGLTADQAALRAQWAHWWATEMSGPLSLSVPIYNCPGNHTVYDSMSERTYREACAHLPQNGPDDQKGLSYFERRDDLLLVTVNTMWTGLGGEGHLETDWLETVLNDHADARWKLVIGHHPAHPVNGYAGHYQRTIGPEYRDRFWSLLIHHRVLAYLCSHILAFDVQVQEGVLQITSAGAGTAHRMPEGIEYLHCVQAAIDADGLRYGVWDDAGRLRETLQWPPGMPPSKTWRACTDEIGPTESRLRTWRLSGRLPDPVVARRQTLLSLSPKEGGSETVWIGLQGTGQRLTVSLAPQPGRSPHSWYGPELGIAERFDVQLALHADMGPGGVLWRAGDDAPWTTLDGASAWGPERLDWDGRWTVGYAGTADRQPFAGSDLDIRAYYDPATPQAR